MKVKAQKTPKNTSNKWNQGNLKTAKCETPTLNKEKQLFGIQQLTKFNYCPTDNQSIDFIYVICVLVIFYNFPNQLFINKNQQNMESSQLTSLIESAKLQLKKQLEFSLFQKKYEHSLEVIEKMIGIDGQNSENYFKRMTILVKLNKFQQALQASKIVIEKGEHSLQFYNLVIKCHIELDQIELAQETIRKALSINEELRNFFNFSIAIQKLSNDDKYKLPEQQQKILQEMKNWLYPKGAKYDKVKIVVQQQGYRGAIATKSIKKDQTIVFIPKSQLLTLQLARQNPISKEIIRLNVQLLSPKHSLMSILLLEQKASGKSKFKPYLDILPQNHSCFPINYSTQQLTSLIGSTFLFQIRQKVLDLKKDYDAISYCSSQFQKKYTFKDFCWARMMIGSRVFGVFIDGVKTEILTPFADMLNHKVPKQTVWNYSQEKSGFFIQSLKDINLGQELFDSYGKKCNSRFLLNYGFVLESNDRNQICLKIDFNSKDPTIQKKISMLKLEKYEDLTKIFRITKFIQQNSFFQMMGYLRFKNIQKIETLNMLEKISSIIRTKQPYKPSRTPPTTMEVQLKIWADLKGICQCYLNDYSTKLSQNIQRLKQQKLSENMKNILTLLIGEKRLYHHYLQISENSLQILSKGYVQARQTTKKSPQNDYCRYIYKILCLMPHEKNQFLNKGLKQISPQLLEEKQILAQNIEEDDQISAQY